MPSTTVIFGDGCFGNFTLNTLIMGQKVNNNIQAALLIILTIIQLMFCFLDEWTAMIGTAL